jgi:hypothetical protein
MEEYKLFMLLLGCRPVGRNTEQHDTYFGIAKNLKDLIPNIKSFWKSSGNIHIDAWRIVNNVDGYQIKISDKILHDKAEKKLFFLNLGGYKENEFEEFHYKILTVSKDKSEAISTAKKTAFYQHTGFGKIATSHIDDKFGVDVDDIFEIKDILTAADKMTFSISIVRSETELPEDVLNLGYFKLASL